MRMPRSEALAWRAIELTSPGPWPTARKMSSSTAALSAAVRWWACRFSNTIVGVNGAAGSLGCIVKLILLRFWGLGSDDYTAIVALVGMSDGEDSGLFKFSKRTLDCYIKLIHYMSNESRSQPTEALPVRTRPGQRCTGVPANHRPGNGRHGCGCADRGRSAPHRAAARSRSGDQSQHRDPRLS